MSRRPWIWTPERLEFLEKNWDKLPIPKLADAMDMEQRTVLNKALKSGLAGLPTNGTLPRGAKALQLVWRPSTEPEEEAA